MDVHVRCRGDSGLGGDRLAGLRFGQQPAADIDAHDDHDEYDEEYQKLAHPDSVPVRTSAPGVVRSTVVAIGDQRGANRRSTRWQSAIKRRGIVGWISTGGWRAPHPAVSPGGGAVWCSIAQRAIRSVNSADVPDSAWPMPRLQPQFGMPQRGPLQVDRLGRREVSVRRALHQQ